MAYMVTTTQPFERLFTNLTRLKETVTSEFF